MGLGIYYLLLPSLEGFLGNELALTITGSIQLLVISLVIIGFISLLTGIYPAWMISKPNAANVVSDSFKTSRRSEYLRKNLFSNSVSNILQIIKYEELLYNINKKIKFAKIF